MIGSCCGVCGVLVMALPIPIVVDNFADYYSEQKKLEAKELKREAQVLRNVIWIQIIIGQEPDQVQIWSVFVFIIGC